MFQKKFHSEVDSIYRWHIYWMNVKLHTILFKDVFLLKNYKHPIKTNIKANVKVSLWDDTLFNQLEFIGMIQYCLKYNVNFPVWMAMERAQLEGKRMNRFKITLAKLAGHVKWCGEPRKDHKELTFSFNSFAPKTRLFPMTKENL